METSETVTNTKLGVGWGWYLLIGLMGKFAIGMQFNHAFSIVVELILFCGIIYFYFNKRKKIYTEEGSFPGFKLSNASLRAGFYALLLFLGSLFVTGITDRLISRF